MQPVIVAFDAVTGRYGIVFHRETCKVTERIMGHKTVDRDWAERRGISACYYCFLECPSCNVCPDCGEQQADGNWHAANCPQLQDEETLAEGDGEGV